MKKILLILSVILMNGTLALEKEGSKSKDQEIAELEEACTSVALPSILGLFPPEMHARIQDDVESALATVDKKHIKTIIDVLAQVVAKMHGEQAGFSIIPDTIKWQILGIDRDLSEAEQNLGEERDEQFSEKSVVLPAKSQAPISKSIHSNSSIEEQSVQKHTATSQVVSHNSAANKDHVQQPINPKTTSTSKRKIATRTQVEAQRNR